MKESKIFNQITAFFVVVQKRAKPTTKSPTIDGSCKAPSKVTESVTGA